jgi:hypothetical protein
MLLTQNSHGDTEEDYEIIFISINLWPIQESATGPSNSMDFILRGYGITYCQMYLLLFIINSSFTPYGA